MVRQSINKSIINSMNLISPINLDDIRNTTTNGLCKTFNHNKKINNMIQAQKIVEDKQTTKINNILHVLYQYRYIMSIVQQHANNNKIYNIASKMTAHITSYNMKGKTNNEIIHYFMPYLDKVMIELNKVLN